MPMSRSLSVLLIKLAAASLAGGAALISFVRLRRRSILSSLRLDLLNSLLLFDGAVRPPSILVTGFHSHGKSALANTVCRILAGERGPLIFRAETAPAGPVAGPARRHVIRADVAGAEDEGIEGEVEGRAEVEIIDGAGISPNDAAAGARADVEADIVGPAEGACVDVAVDCVIVVVRCGAPPKERRLAVRRLADVASAVRDRGLHLVVVLTQKKALRSAKQAEELRREVAYRARTDCVYFIENYNAGSTAVNVRHPVTVKNDFATHLTVLAIVRQCVEFARLYRSHSSRTASAGSPPAINLPLVKEQ